MACGQRDVVLGPQGDEKIWHAIGKMVATIPKSRRLATLCRNGEGRSRDWPYRSLKNTVGRLREWR